MSTELFPSLDWCWKGLSQCGSFPRYLWVQEQSEEQFFSIFLLQTSSSKALIANYKILVTKQWQATKHFHVFVRMMCSVPCGHSCSPMSHCAVTRARHMEPVLACVPPFPFPLRVSDSPAPPGFFSRSSSFPGSCGANLLHGISGMAWLGSAQLSGVTVALAGLAVSPGLVQLPVCVLLPVESWFFVVLKGFMVTWWCDWVGRRFLLVALQYNYCISVGCCR